MSRSGVSCATLVAGTGMREAIVPMTVHQAIASPHIAKAPYYSVPTTPCQQAALVFSWLRDPVATSHPPRPAPSTLHATPTGGIDDKGEADGLGPEARFSAPRFIASDGAGCLFVLDDDRLRKLALPPSWRADQLPCTPRPANPYPLKRDTSLGARGTQAMSVGSAGGGNAAVNQNAGGAPAPAATVTAGTAAAGMAEAGVGAGPRAGAAPGQGSGVVEGRGTLHVCPGEQAEVSTIHSSTECINALVYDPTGAGSLVYATSCALYRLHVGGRGTARTTALGARGAGGDSSRSRSPNACGSTYFTAASDADASEAAVTAVVTIPAAAGAAARTSGSHPCGGSGADAGEGSSSCSGLGGSGSGSSSNPDGVPNRPLLLAGQEGACGQVDGRGSSVRFSCVSGLVVDAGGNVLLVDGAEGTDVVVVRRVAPDGTTTTVASCSDGLLHTPFILPSGYLALVGYKSQHLHVLDLGLVPAVHLAAAGSCREGVGSWARRLPRTLQGDLYGLLERQPDGTADLTVEVSERRFYAHRAILAARCDYFRQRLEGGFADGGEQLLQLPDADPEAFEVVLRHIYTGEAGEVPGRLLRPAAELADRLLLPELCVKTQAALMAGVSPETVVDLLLWAEARGPAFGGLLRALKEWYVGHQREVLRCARDSVRRLAGESPDLMVELYEMGQDALLL